MWGNTRGVSSCAATTQTARQTMNGCPCLQQSGTVLHNLECLLGSDHRLRYPPSRGLLSTKLAPGFCGLELAFSTPETRRQSALKNSPWVHRDEQQKRSAVSRHSCRQR
ncbi:hypothetical protein EMIT0P218_10015 [Pseudomonas sp. IT-P218]